MKTRLAVLTMLIGAGAASLRPQAQQNVPLMHLDEVKKIERKGHDVYPLLNKKRGTLNGFDSMVGVYKSEEYVITGTHTDQEMFFVLEGSGWALVGDREIPIRPGSNWVVMPGQVHGIKRDSKSPHVKAFFVHGAP